MALLRSLIYVGLIMVVVGGWIANRMKKKPVVSSESYTTLPSLETLNDIYTALENPNWKIRLSAIETLKTQQNAESLMRLVKMLEDPVVEVREATSFAILPYGSDAISELEQVLNTGKVDAREMAVVTLSAIDSSAIVPVLVNALQTDESAWVRISAIHALAKIGGDDAHQALSMARNDPNPQVIKALDAI